MDEQEPLLLRDNESEAVEQHGQLYVPYEEIITYDFAGFEDFDVRHGYGEISPDDVTQLLQSWLYFGLLSEFLGRPVSKVELEPNDVRGLPAFTSNGLQTLLHRFDTRASRLGFRTRKSHLDALFGILFTANSWCAYLESIIDDVSSHAGHMCLAVRILISSLAIVLLPNESQYKDMMRNQMRSANEPERTDYAEFRERYIRIINPCPVKEYNDRGRLSAQILAIRMRDMGWCSHQVDHALKSYDYATCAYLSFLRRPTSRPHLLCEGTSKCVADNTDMNNYSTRHVTRGCECAHIASPIDEIVEIIKKGRIPLVRFAESSSGDLYIQVCERSAQSRYVVMSHVWADGLGNPSANSLPACISHQLLTWLQNLPLPSYEVGIILAKKRYDASHLDVVKTTSWFWMDTLCIPVNDEHADLRSAAINDMATVYVGATQVLVLDAELLNMSAEEYTRDGSDDLTPDRLDALEVLARTVFCTWSRRSWTFQEGAIGPECIFQLGNTAVSITSHWAPSGPRHPLLAGDFKYPDSKDLVHLHIFKTLYERTWDMLHRTYEPARHRSDDNLYHRPFPHPGRAFGSISLIADGTLNRQERHHGEVLARVWNELAHRSTTKAEDIHIIMANLLDFDAHTLMRLPRGQRMAIMMRSIDGVPFSIFYSRGRTRSSAVDPTLRWMPEEPGDCKLHRHQYMELTRHGFSAAVQDEHTTSLFFARQQLTHHITTRCELLKMHLNIRIISMLKAPNLGESKHGYLIVFPRPPKDDPDNSNLNIRLDGVCFKVEGYSVSTLRGKRSQFRGTEAEHLHISYCCPVTVRARYSTAEILPSVKSESANTLEQTHEVQTSSVVGYVQSELVPSNAFYLIKCDLHRYPKLHRRQISSSRLSAGVIYVLMYFSGHNLLTAFLFTIIVVIIGAVRKQSPDPIIVLIILYLAISGLFMVILLFACCVALAHEERCLLLESFNSRNKTEARVPWTGWVLIPLYKGLGCFLNVLEEFMSKSESWRDMMREDRRDQEISLVSLGEERQWQWAEERGIPKIDMGRQQRGITTTDPVTSEATESASRSEQQEEYQDQDEGEDGGRWGASPEDVPLVQISRRI